MVDLDIPSNQNPHTFLHWVQTGLTPATTASSIPVSNGTIRGFTLYTQVLVDTSSMTRAGLSALQSGAQARVGFDTASVLEAAGLSNSVVAGNSFNVTNPGGAVSSAGFRNFTSASVGDSTGSVQGSGQISNPDNEGFKGFGATNGGGGLSGGGTLTTTISSAPAGPTSGLTQAGNTGSQTSAASTSVGWSFGYPIACMVVFGSTFILSSTL
ncbi:hypothetical protein KVR01_011996 [Diaporthe batatas]|uniref:uncharacterized protein n=1 Tax=Diaporthe batatas TaxID=748121 RepID=UPI001D0501B7|nr:uncharacterized protein KVR01_011996 [Diaporthe batatas]KAG8158235.1 hypothetical protein KVR01_011996 [Diaporthe batatas]